ncbi:hypothetical protein [Sulfuriflexus mobilis]|uniref:hypothetical protein n=1 Tax=Sulfuriflexus mobilis TaxID=1811807 RepID=UPI000F81B040|nr:hypothetical protein [Sulfuriflexus mobilis]
MNKILGLIVLLMASLVQAAPLQDVQFDDIAFKHAWENKESIITNEYVEEGQTLDNWQHLLAYRQYPGHDEPAEVIRQYLTQIKPTQKPAVYKRDESSKDIILVFLVEADDKSHLEFNIHRFVAEDGIVRSYQFAARNFKRKLSALGDEISEKKSKWIGLVGRLRAADFTH